MAETIMPKSEERSALSSLVELLQHPRSRTLTVLSGDTQAEVPASVQSVLTQIAEILASGRGLAIMAIDRELTTREAADLLGISRPTLIKLLDAGEIDYTRPNSSRRIPLDQVLAYRERRSRKRRQILAEMTADAVDMGLYGSPSTPDRPGDDD
jgi:excisionase family DNA binding protein